jgi:hypothetical protein
MKTITKDELEKRYRTEKNLPLCESLGISHGTLISLLDSAGIKHKGRGNRTAFRVNKKYEVK